MPSTLAVCGGASTAVGGLYLVRTALERFGKGAIEAALDPSLRLDGSNFENPCPYHLPVFEQETECGSRLFVSVTVLFGLVVGSVLTDCCCVLREHSMNSTHCDSSQWL